MTPLAKRLKAELQQAQADKYKAEQETLRLKREKEECEAKKKKNWSAIVYCDNCLVVNSVSIPPTTNDQTVAQGNCVTCGIHGHLHLVRECHA